MGRPPKQNGQREDALPSAHTNTAVLEDEDEKYILVHWRLLARNVNNLGELVAQLETLRPDLYRRIYDTGDRVVSALEPPDPHTGLRGSYREEALARGLINVVNALIDFELKNGQVPTIIRMQAHQIAELQDLRALIHAELRSLLQGELRAMLREEIPPILAGLEIAAPPAFLQDGRHEPAAGILTGTAPGVDHMIDDLFNNT